MIKYLIPVVLLAVPLSACSMQQTQENPTTYDSGFSGESWIEDGEIATKPVTTNDADTISAKEGESFSLKSILSAMYGNDIEVSNIVCSKGASEINGDTVTVHGNSIIGFYLTMDDATSYKELKMLSE